MHEVVQHRQSPHVIQLDKKKWITVDSDHEEKRTGKHESTSKASHVQEVYQVKLERLELSILGGKESSIGEGRRGYL